MSVDYPTVREHWLAGRCFCCGEDELGNPDTPPVTAAPGVRMCGDCVRRGHDDGDVLPALLEAAATGIDP